MTFQTLDSRFGRENIQTFKESLNYYTNRNCTWLAQTRCWSLLRRNSLIELAQAPWNYCDSMENTRAVEHLPAAAKLVERFLWWHEKGRYCSDVQAYSKGVLVFIYAEKLVFMERCLNFNNCKRPASAYRILD